MNERAREQVVGNQQDFRRYVRGVIGSSSSTADELAKLADLRDRGVISPEEFAQAKARLLGTPDGAPHRQLARWPGCVRRLRCG
jgi:hypothetical protein